MAEKSAVNHPIFARFFDRLSEKEERLGQAEHRHQLLAGLSGRVIEVGAGNGLNFKSYPPGHPRSGGRAGALPARASP
ncbi:MAG TPA: hypothetical protein VGP30_02370 [Candidatus Limnocylindrales bacterium]|nr:hypothetical protein [Candidatus Limnocylindrales bacterium]